MTFIPTFNEGIHGGGGRAGGQGDGCDSGARPGIDGRINGRSAPVLLSRLASALASFRSPCFRAGVVASALASFRLSVVPPVRRYVVPAVGGHRFPQVP